MSTSVAKCNKLQNLAKRVSNIVSQTFNECRQTLLVASFVFFSHFHILFYPLSTYFIAFSTFFSFFTGPSRHLSVCLFCAKFKCNAANLQWLQVARSSVYVYVHVYVSDCLSVCCYLNALNEKLNAMQLVAHTLYAHTSTIEAINTNKRDLQKL